jgi:hypothetical protein
MISIIGTLALLGCQFPSTTSVDKETERKVLNAIEPMYASPIAEEGTSISANIAVVDLNGDGVNEVLAYVTGDGACGSGGCNLFILQSKNGRYDPITELSITWPPIRILDSKSNGWHDIGVRVQGGGILPGYEARLRFDGNSYPSNPSLVPRHKNGLPSGHIVIDRSSPATALHK